MFTDVSWQDIYSSANASFDSIPAMIEAPIVVKTSRKIDTTFREKLGAALFGAIMIFGSALAILPRRRKSV